PNKPIPGSVSKRKLDVGLAYNPNNELEDSDRQSCDWSHILIPGELKSNSREDNYSSTWLDLLRYAREIFSAQDTRRFVLGFTLCGSTMRLWEFDRLGVVGSTPFDINKDGQMLVSAILGYLWMSEEELGFDSTILDDGGRYTQIQRGGRMERLCLEERIKRQRSVAGRATTCWRGSLGDEPDSGLVIKDSWEFEERPEEGLLLKEATEAGVKNVARYYHHETVHTGGEVDDVRHNVRKGLSNTGGRNPFQQRRPTLPEAVTSATMSSGSRPSRGRSRSTSTSRTITRKRSSSCVQTSMPPPKRSCSNSPVKQGAHQRRNRVHRRLIMRDIGKSIYEASSLRAVLTGLLGGIKGHESLLDAKILHRDISIGNIMLKMGEDDGFLIDLDLAIRLDRQRASGAPSKTGTKVFMAIGTLYGDEDHSFMHDLESFFWVLFWICVHWNGPGLPRSKTEYESWNYKDTRELAREKAGLVIEEDKFTNENFSAYCKPLIPCLQELRKVVFPEGKRWLREHRQLYTQMKSVLDQARKDLGTLE
ncbi:hypothetical protein K469DRAFT_614801, partial [Zopfia rhizophila CBS 207.26]